MIKTTTIEKRLEELLGSKQDDKFIIEDKITVKVEEQYGSIYLWIEDRRGKHAFAWLFNVEETEYGYKLFSDKYEYIECDSIEKVFEIVKKREH